MRLPRFYLYLESLFEYRSIQYEGVALHGLLGENGGKRVKFDERKCMKPKRIIITRKLTLGSQKRMESKSFVSSSK